MNTVIIVIPIYKEVFDEDEEKNVRNTIKCLDNYEICFVAPCSLNRIYYEKNFPQIGCTVFDDKFFDGIKGYNHLMLSAEFYEKFLTFKYLCICQPDVWILQDGQRLEYFLALGYDYIGAPWIPRHYITVLPDRGKIKKALNLFLPKYYVEVGNGGFSLRKVESMIRILKGRKWFVHIWPHYEDYFYAYMGAYHKAEFHTAPIEIAKEFSLETNCKEIMKKEKIVPLGIHAYQKYYPNVSEQY